MPCDTKLKAGQTISDRKKEISDVVAQVARDLVAGKLPTIGKNGGIAFNLADKRDVTDACIYRRLMATGSPLAKAALQRAELMSGAKVNPQALAHGLHSHDGGKTWHNGH